MKHLLFISIFIYSANILGQAKDSSNMVSHCEQAYFPGGNQSMNTFLKANLKIDTTSLLHHWGKVYVEITIDSTGKVRDPKIKKGLEPSIDREVLRLFEIMPDWIPMICDGKREKVRMIIPVIFRVQ